MSITEIPLHTNASETDIRDYVKVRKISGGTRSDLGRQCRDTFAWGVFLGLSAGSHHINGPDSAPGWPHAPARCLHQRHHQFL